MGNKEFPQRGKRKRKKNGEKEDFSCRKIENNTNTRSAVESRSTRLNDEKSSNHC